MRGALFVDASGWLACLDANEAQHADVARLLDSAKGTLVSTSYVADETITFTLRRYGHPRAVQIADSLHDSDVVDLVHVAAEDEREALELFRDRPDKTYSFTDCTSFVVMRRLGIDTVVTLDEDFRREGFTVLP